MDKKNKPKLSVNVYLPPYFKAKEYVGDAHAVASENDLGPFSILPEHANFITMIKKKIEIFDLEDKKVSYNFSRGVLEVSDDKVAIFLGI